MALLFQHEPPLTSIQWFPGHMHLTRQAIRDRMKAGIDVVVELLDARCPASSANPLLAQLTQTKPALKLLNKADLADPDRTAAWLAHYNGLPHTRAIAIQAGPGAAKQVMSTARAMAPLRISALKPLRLLVCGIPNVGKSTLINALMGHMGGRPKAAKVGNEPGITKVEQKLMPTPDCLLYDTPGMLWPKIRVPQAGWNLAASGAVGRNALDEELVAVELIDRLEADYPAALHGRYAVAPAASAEERLEAIGRARGAVMSGGRVNLQKAAELLLTDFRAGKLGRITLETPEGFARWLADAEAAEAAADSASDADDEDARD